MRTASELATSPEPERTMRPESEHPTVSPMLLAGRYRVARRLGRGGLGVADLVHDTTDGDRPLVAKRVRTDAPEDAPEAYEALAGEFVILSRLDHPHLVRASDFGRETGGWFLIEELVDGPGLVEALAEEDPGEALERWSGELLSALGYLHDRGVVHGDVSPANVRVADGRVRLIDLSAALERSSGGHSRLGTPGFIAPEVTAGERPGPAADLYAAGRLLEQALAGREPSGRRAGEIRDLIAGLTETDPGLRVSNAHQALALLAGMDPSLPHGARADEAPLLGRERELEETWGRLTAGDEEGGRLSAAAMVVVDGAVGMGKSRLLEALATRARLAGLRVHSTLGDARTRLPEGLLVLDPLPHPASEAGRRLRALAPDAAAGCAVAGAPRSAEEAAGWRSSLAEALSEESALWIDLAPLDPCASTELARWIAPRSAGPADLEALARRAGGNPLLLVELERAARQGRLSATTGRGVTALSESVRTLPDDERSMLAALALLAVPASPRVLGRILEVPESAAHTALRSLEARGLARPDPERAFAWHPRHGLAAEAALSFTPSPQRKRWHERAAALREEGALDRDPVAWARDLARAGETSRAIELLASRSDAQAERLRRPDARELLEELTDACAGAPPATDAALFLAGALDAVGRPESALALLDGAPAADGAAGEAARIELARARILKSAGRVRQALELLGARERGEADPEVCELEMRLLTLDGRPAAALARLDRLVAAGGEISTAHEVQRGYAALALSDPASARTSFEAASRAHPGADGSIRALAMNGLGSVAMATGDASDAARHFERAVEEAAAASVRERASFRLNLATARHAQGSLLEALVAYREAAEELRSAGATRELAHALASRANLLSLLGDPGAASALAEEAATLGGPPSGPARRDPFPLAVLASISLETDELERAAQAAAELASLVEAGSREHVLATLVEGEVARRRGDGAIARTRADTALASAREHDAPELAGRALLLRGRLADRSDEQRATDLREALSAFERAGERTGAAEAARALADEHAARGEEREARELRERADAALLEQARQLPDRFRPRYLRLRGAAPEDRTSTHERAGEPARPPVDETDPARDDERYRLLLEINRGLASEHRRDRLLERILDGAIRLANAERGFLLLDDGDVAVARNLDRASLRKSPPLVSRTIAEQVLAAGETFLTGDALEDSRLALAGSVHSSRVRAVLCVPCRGGAGVVGALYLDHRFLPRVFGAAESELIEALADQAAIALENVRLEETLRARTAELERAQQVSERAYHELRRESEEQRRRIRAFEQGLRASGGREDHRRRHPGIIGSSAPMLELMGLLERVVETDAPVLISGESGSGKELVARAVHLNGARGRAPFVTVNCGALPETLLEATLFGHSRGAFTGADRDRRGLFEEADGGTLFLDEVGEMPPSMQVKLLRALQDGEIRPLGSERVVRVNVRVLAATHRELRDEVRAGRFREDLLYRLEVISIRVPPLRERMDDLPVLATHLLAQTAERMGGTPPAVSPAAMRLLLSHDWPGNVRELGSVLETARVLSGGGSIEPEHVALSPSFRARRESAPGEPPPDGTKRSSFREQVLSFERRTLAEAVARAGWNVAAAARMLGLDRGQMFRLLRKHGIERPAEDG